MNRAKLNRKRELALAEVLELVEEAGSEEQREEVAHLLASVDGGERELGLLAVVLAAAGRSLPDNHPDEVISEANEEALVGELYNRESDRTRALERLGAMNVSERSRARAQLAAGYKLSQEDSERYLRETSS